MTPEHWLNIATHGLEAGATARVRGEYLAHLEDALDAGESVAAVLAEWGDPHAANRELREAHQTMLMRWLLPAAYAPTGSGLWTALSDEIFSVGTILFAAFRWLAINQAFAVVVVIAAMLLLRWLVLSRPFTLPVRTAGYWLLSPAFVGLLLFMSFPR